MKLLFYSPQFLPSVGGLQNVVHSWANELGKNGHAVTVICATRGTEPAKMNYKVIRNPSFWKTAGLMKDADLVVMFNVSLKAIPQWFLSRTPLVISHHTAYRYEHLPATWQQKVKRQVANRLAADNIACSRFMAKDYKNCTVVPNPFDNTLFYDNRQPRTPGSILFVGRLVSDKGVDLLIGALAIINAMRPGQLNLTIVGKGPDEKVLREMVHSKKLEEQTRFTGVLQSHEIAGLMNNHAIVVVPSRMEPFGLVVLEGLACGCEIIASNQGGLPEAGGSLAHYFENGAVDSLVAVLLQVMAGKKLNDLLSRGRHLSQFSLKSSGTQFEKHLQTIPL